MCKCVLVVYDKEFRYYLCFRFEISKDEPKIVYGKTAYQLPKLPLGIISKRVVTAMTGPNGGLTTVNKKQRHLSISDPDVHFIDIVDEDTQPGWYSLMQ